MNMTMYTMNMNIYISKENEKWLRTEDSMSGLINRLLEEHYSGKVVKTPSAPTPEKNKSVGKPNYCKLHQMDKEYCGLMKH